MTKRVQGVQNDPRRKVRFKEQAREIVAVDRYNRRYGKSVDTAGAIAQALERAYREGVLDGRNGPPPVPEPPMDGPVEWVMIPPRPRSAFWSICLFTLSKGDRPEQEGWLEPSVTNRGTPGWQRVVGGEVRDYDAPMGERTIMPLVKLGLMEPAANNPSRLVISQRGRETWAEFLRRGGQYPEDLTDV